MIFILTSNYIKKQRKKEVASCFGNGGAFDMKNKNWLVEKLAAVVERFQFHREKVTADNPVVSEFAEKMCEIDMYELWMLTQVD